MDEPGPARATGGMPAPASSVAPVVSVIVPAWNAAATIGRALDSVLDEGRVAVEVVVVDDASGDGTGDLVAERARDDPRIVVERAAANEGVSAARNRGLEVARGEWLAFLDADDRLLPGGLAALVAATDEGWPLVVVGQRIWSDGEREWVSAVYDIPDIREPGRKSIATHPGLLYYASSTGKLLHRSLLDGLTFEGRVLGDQPWTIRAMLRAGDRIRVIGDTVYEWSRPVSDEDASTITARSRSSAAAGAEAAGVAIVAFRAVAAEAAERVVDEEHRQRVVGTYLERLARSDLGGYVRRALARDDADLPLLLGSIGTFLGTVPPETLAAAGAVRRLLVRPPLEQWRGLSGAGRRAFATVVAPVALADDGIVGRVARWRLVRRVLGGTGSLAAPAAAVAGVSLLLTHAHVRSWPRRGWRRMRRAVGGTTPVS